MTAVVVSPPSPRGQARLQAGGHTSSSDMGCHQTPFHVMMFADKERALAKGAQPPPLLSTTLFSKGYWVTFLQLCPHTHIYTHSEIGRLAYRRGYKAALRVPAPVQLALARLSYTHTAK